MGQSIHSLHPLRRAFPAILLSFAILSGLVFFAKPMASRAQKAGTGERPAKDLGIPLPPQYQIVDIGIVQAGDTASQGFGVSTGGTGVGRSVRTGGAQAFIWTSGGGIVGLPNLAGRAFCVSNGANNTGQVAGTCASTLFGTARLPVIWQNGVISPLPLPAKRWATLMM